MQARTEQGPEQPVSRVLSFFYGLFFECDCHRDSPRGKYRAGYRHRRATRSTGRGQSEGIHPLPVLPEKVKKGKKGQNWAKLRLECSAIKLSSPPPYGLHFLP